MRKSLLMMTAAMALLAAAPRIERKEQNLNDLRTRNRKGNKARKKAERRAKNANRKAKK